MWCMFWVGLRKNCCGLLWPGMVSETRLEVAGRDGAAGRHMSICHFGNLTQAS